MNAKQCKSLDEVRSNIDSIDDEIIKLIAQRGEYVTQAAAFKKSEDAVRDSSRVKAVIQNVRSKAERYGADPEFIEVFYSLMIGHFTEKEMSEFKGEPK